MNLRIAKKVLKRTTNRFLYDRACIIIKKHRKKYLLLNLRDMPKNFTVMEWINFIKETGIIIIDKKDSVDHSGKIEEALSKIKYI